jgi:hypothetical protein
MKKVPERIAVFVEIAGLRGMRVRIGVDRGVKNDVPTIRRTAGYVALIAFR